MKRQPKTECVFDAMRRLESDSDKVRGEIDAIQSKHELEIEGKSGVAKMTLGLGPYLDGVLLSLSSSEDGNAHVYLTEIQAVLLAETIRSWAGL